MIRSAKKTVVVAMSGGVDSSVAAWLLKKQGFEVVGMMLKLWTEQPQQENRCCNTQSVQDARMVAYKLDIPFYLLDYKAEFAKTIVQPFLNDYAAGLTPNPCLRCNQLIRFDSLLQKALHFGADFMATGHYAIVKPEKNTADTQINQEQAMQYGLYKAVDQEKDQSYMLHRLSQKALRHSLFPLGEWTKNQVRAMAAEQQLKIFSKKDSQDLCFLGKDGLKGFLQRNLPQTPKPGPIYNLQGEKLGEHQGVQHYTIGQRKGLNLSLTEPHYVCRIDSAENTVYLAKKEEIGWDRILVRDFHWINQNTYEKPYTCKVLVRYHAKPIEAVVQEVQDKQITLRFLEKQFPITPGQGAVLYLGDKVLGGGYIQLPR